jgi:hypothetical protein
MASGRMVLVFGLVLSGMTALSPSTHAADPAASGFPVYQPPLRGAPLARMGGGTRGEGDDAPEVYVLTPEHAGLTSRDQPVLYWYLSRAAKARYEFVLMAETDYEPLVETELAIVKAAGIQRISLADFDIRLKPDVPYQWSVAVVMDEEQRSGNILASGMIVYVESPPAVINRAADAGGEERIHVYAGAGLWYDALQSLDELISAGTDAERMRQVRASLLEQVGLEKVAAATAGL